MEFNEMLSEEREKQALELLELFKQKMRTEIKKISEEVIGELYSNVLPFIESDGWHNMKMTLMREIEDYKNSGSWGMKKIRDKIFKEHYNEIIKDVNNDLLQENVRLNKQVDDLRSLLNKFSKDFLY
jgi:hypothetical protein